MAKKHILAIDETGNFYSQNWSSVCGVLVKGNELELKKAYQKSYSDFGFPEPVTNDINSLLQTSENIEDNARFHFNKMTDSQKEILKTHLLPFVDKLFVSKGKPVLFANNQNWWLIAVTVVIKEFLRECEFGKGDEVEIWIDNRNEKVFGVAENVEFKDYHDNIKQQIENNVKRFVPDNNLKISFKSDTTSLFINLADVCCGLRESKELSDRVIFCDCKSMYDYLDPVAHKDKNPFVALCAIIQEADNKNFRNIAYTEEILKKLRCLVDDYHKAWDIFYDFLKLQISERESDSALVKIKVFVEIFLKEFKNAGKEKVLTSKCLELMVLFVEYYSHIGEIETPFLRDEVEIVMQKSDKKSETRILRKWEKLISFTLRESQIFFNAYDFETANNRLVDVWEKHETIVNALGKYFSEKDEPTTALLGSLAQSYAFNNDFDNAIDYFELSKNYAIKTTATTDSYLFNIYHRLGDADKCKECYERMSKGKKPEGNLWNMLAYSKLRALELYKNKTSEHPAIDLFELKNYNAEYPFPLIMKWEAIALYLEDENAHKEKIEKYFSDAIENLLRTENGFTIKTLALPLIQCYSFINKQNRFHAQYNQILNELKKQSSYFEQYVEQKATLLDSIKNDAELWERAISLPFIYA